MIQRNTIQCALVFETVNKLHCHATADEVYEAIALQHANISKATVYRNLNRLSDMGKIRKLEIPGGAECFDHQCHPHYHLRCEKCGKVFDVDMEYLGDLEQKLRQPTDFLITGCDIFFKGVCPACRE